MGKLEGRLLRDIEYLPGDQVVLFRKPGEEAENILGIGGQKPEPENLKSSSLLLDPKISQAMAGITKK